MLEIIFVRHGESKMNKESLYCGWTDSFLTDKGVKQAEAVRKKLAGEEIKLIISSDLNRCFITAEIINKDHRKRIEKESSLKELNFGIWEGLSYDEIINKFPVEAKYWAEDFTNFKIPRGESLMEMHERVNNTFEKIINKYKKGKILIVTHGGVIRSILSEQITGSIDGYWKFKIENCGITRLQITEGFPILSGINQ
ncbi:alpha-ribazole phosphatase [Maledivibacter halophilus]|uniref:Alpha-ribazole phosphatase n=1 Tax=Maledivibacter halophilus TaxID=36842 RepID=A0A1T5LIE6_9FIRM|nr:alpha-ribazole phosphatase [Maledivibacter halophilus]SKC75766.1 alpha-ribazole phosphatase [Maledivibacter halophilus]